MWSVLEENCRTVSIGVNVVCYSDRFSMKTLFCSCLVQLVCVLVQHFSTKPQTPRNIWKKKNGDVIHMLPLLFCSKSKTHTRTLLNVWICFGAQQINHPFMPFSVCTELPDSGPSFLFPPVFENSRMCAEVKQIECPLHPPKCIHVCWQRDLWLKPPCLVYFPLPPNRMFSCASHSRRQINFTLCSETTFELCCVEQLCLLWLTGHELWIRRLNDGHKPSHWAFQALPSISILTVFHS